MHSLYKSKKAVSAALLTSLVWGLTGLQGQDTDGVRGFAHELDPFAVIGDTSNVYFTPGAGYVVDGTEISGHNYDNIEQVMRRVPGVYFRTEDGFGIFPNISFRGVGSMRTTKLTVMEDGILSAPAPYANPAAYYTPTTGRMSGIEILKGSSQVRFGPHNTGGVLNYRSTPIPFEGSGRIRLSYGENGDMRFHGYYGEVFQTGMGELGVLFEHYFRQNDGFKRMDTSPTYGGGDTGFTKNEPMLKLSWVPNTDLRQRFEVKVGYTDMDADETYLGLTTEDFRANPFRRYVSTQFDEITTEQWRSYLRHELEFSETSRLASTVYYNSFSRSWYKLHDVRRAGGLSSSLSNALAGGGFYDSNGLVEGTEGEPLAVLKGEAAGIWRVRDNNRAYKSYGAQSIFQHGIEAGGAFHAIEIGVRLHEDYEDRFQKQDDFEVDDSGNVIGSTFRAPGTQDNRRGTARALAIHAQDRIEWDRWAVTPGIRYERVRYTDERRGMNPVAADFNQVILKRQSTLDVFAPGIAAHYEATDQVAFFGGVHRGFSLPSPSAAAAPSNPIGEERSLGYELGTRYRNQGGIQGEVVLFLTHFDDLIVPDNIGGAGTGVTENAGEVRTYGLETALSYDPGRQLGWGYSTPLQLAFTWTDATIRSDVSASGDSGGAVESIFAGGSRGNRLPYIPRCQISFGAGVDFERFGIFLDAFYVASTYASANNSAEEVNPFGGPGNTPAPDARFGKNDAYFLLDLTAQYRVNDRFSVQLSVQNLLDREYIASRVPHGPRPGHPRFVSLGISYDL